jgi:hypothetical protein
MHFIDDATAKQLVEILGIDAVKNFRIPLAYQGHDGVNNLQTNLDLVIG